MTGMEGQIRKQKCQLQIEPQIEEAAWAGSEYRQADILVRRVDTKAINVKNRRIKCQRQAGRHQMLDRYIALDSLKYWQEKLVAKPSDI